ncbi:MAG: M6 family metalloprotease domain-containing protein [bacterium]
MTRYSAAVLLVLGFVFSAVSMPLHPNLISKMDAKTRQAAALNQRMLESRGIDNPALWPVPPVYREIPLNGAMKTDSAPDSFRVIVLLVDFSDHPATTDAAFFDSLMFGSSHGAVRDFYREVSYQALEISTNDSCNTIGWLRMPNPYTYYVDGQKGFGTYPNNAQKLVEDAVTAANPFVDFTRYDNDGDGYVDGLMVVHSGTGYELSGDVNDIHSHAWYVYGSHLGMPKYRMPVDGIFISSYAMQPEFWEFGPISFDMTLGVFVHEMGHSIFGLPDLYDYDYDSEGLGSWSLMASGSWNGFLGDSPAHPDIWCLTKMGFVTPINVTEDVDSFALASIQSGPNALRLWTDGGSSQEYFLVENRRKTSYDSTLPGEGLLVYHVDESVYFGNDHQWYPGHTASGHYLVALEQADGLYELEKNGNADTSDPYPGSLNVHTFNQFTTPASKSYAGEATYVALSDFSDSADIMNFNINVTTPSAPILSEATFDAMTGIVSLAWEPYDTSNPGGTLYNVYRNDALLASTINLAWSDTLDVGGFYRYALTIDDDLLLESQPFDVFWEGLSSVAVEVSHALPSRFTMSPAYPNPFNPMTTIRLQLPQGTHLTVDVVNTLGQQVAILYDGSAGPGDFPLTIDGHSWSSGIYLVRGRTSSGNFAVMRIALLR